jgi:hypothetical protein
VGIALMRNVYTVTHDIVISPRYVKVQIKEYHYYFSVVQYTMPPPLNTSNNRQALRPRIYQYLSSAPHFLVVDPRFSNDSFRFRPFHI